MRALILTSIALVFAASALQAQGSNASGAMRPAPARSGPVVVPPAAQQIASAVLALPDSLRPGARVWGYAPDGSFTELRPAGANGSMTCIASDPKDNRFHVACYHNSLEPFMARGRELRAQGADQNAVDSIREAEAKSGRIHMPANAALYQLMGPDSVYNAATNTVHGARSMFVIYVPFATPETTGLSAQPKRGEPWLMDPGKAKAHIMLVPTM
ncbi:MAG TPA: hypothetical protein VGI92_14885 [Gemmatimonadales bacterium]|jgi:hypothetical protein